jgi:alpha-L-fucosidase
MTINETWAYNKNDRNFKSPTVLIRMLVEVASKGGNLLLDVGPTPEGTIQPEFQERLREIGKWLKVSGEAIYGTTYGPLYGLPFGRSTARGNTVYLHIFDWPQGKLELSMPERRVSQVTLLAGRKVLPFRQSQDKLVVDIPSQAPDPHVSVLAIEAR